MTSFLEIFAVCENLDNLSGISRTKTVDKWLANPLAQQIFDRLRRAFVRSLYELSVNTYILDSPIHHVRAL